MFNHQNKLQILCSTTKQNHQ